jgi:hypothetical protein
MQPADSLSCPQGPATGPCPERIASSPLSYSISLRSILILSSQLHLDLRSGLFPSDLPNIVICISNLSRAFYMPRWSYPPCTEGNILKYQKWELRYGIPKEQFYPNTGMNWKLRFWTIFSFSYMERDENINIKIRKYESRYGIVKKILKDRWKGKYRSDFTENCDFLLFFTSFKQEKRKQEIHSVETAFVSSVRMCVRSDRRLGKNFMHLR